MTEKEWLACGEPGRLLAHLEGEVSERKLRLFAVACCRGVWHLLEDGRSRNAVEAAQRHADGLAEPWELAAFRGNVRAQMEHWRAERHTVAPADLTDLQARQAAQHAALLAASRRPARAARRAARAGGLAEARAVRTRERARLVHAWGTQLAAVPAELAPATWQALSVPAWWAVQAEESQAVKAQAAREAVEQRRQSDLLRELLGNPFRPTAFDPAWLRWQGGVIPRMARAIYEEGAYDQMPVLGDALEEAGCADADLLAHLRGPDGHARGCWALDGLLGQG